MNCVINISCSYFLSVLADRKDPILKKWKAVEGISGIAVVYTLFAIVLTCCLGGITVLAFTAIVIDVLLCGGMIAIAILLRHGLGKCNGQARNPVDFISPGFNGFGEGSSSGGKHNITYAAKYTTTCGLNKAAFAVAVIGAFLFLVTAAFQVQLARSHKKEKRFGPGPDNNYTSGKKAGFFARRKAKKNAAVRDAEMGPSGTAVASGGLAAGTHDMRPSHETGYTGSTVAAPNTGAYDKVEGHHGTIGNGAANGSYYAQPTGTATNY